jgi:hypothetical protein
VRLSCEDFSFRDFSYVFFAKFLSLSLSLSLPLSLSLSLSPSFHQGLTDLEGIAVGLFPDITFTTPYVIHNALRTLPPSWPVVIVTKKERMAKREILLHGIVSKDASLLRGGRDLATSLFILPVLPEPFDRNFYACYLLQHKFWADIPARHALIIQHDSAILRIDDGLHDLVPGRFLYLRDFFQYSYIGGPFGWKKCVDDRECFDSGNGGFSLRNVSVMMEITASRDYAEKMLVGKVDRYGCLLEDITFSEYYATRPDLTHTLAPRYIGNKFAMDSSPSEMPLGVHQTYRFLRPSSIQQKCGPGFGEEVCWHMRNLSINPACCGTAESVRETAKRWMKEIGAGYLYNMLLELVPQ